MDEPGVEIRKSRRAKVLSLKAELNLQVEAKKKVGELVFHKQCLTPCNIELQEAVARPNRSIPCNIELQEAVTSEARQEQDHGGCGLPIAGREYQHLYSLLPGRHVQIDTLLMLLIGVCGCLR